MSKVYYLAGRFDRKDELAGYARQIEAAGGRVSSRWLTGVHDVASEQELTNEHLSEFAYDDLDDIAEADVFILFTEEPSVGYTTGGRMVEFGYALNSNSFKRCYIIGPWENIFTRLNECEQYDTWADFAEAMGW